MSSEATSHLQYYCERVPEGVVKAARGYGHRGGGNYPTTIVRLKSVRNHRLGDEEIGVEKVHPRDGVVVRHFHHEKNLTEHYVMEEELVQAFVSTLVEATDFIVDDGDDDYLPPSVVDTKEEKEMTAEEVFGEDFEEESDFPVEDHPDVNFKDSAESGSVEMKNMTEKGVSDDGNEFAPHRP